MVPSSRRVAGADGLTLQLLDWGGVGDVLLFAHGFGHDAHVWDDVAPAFCAAHHVLALDLRGHGESDRDPGFRYHHAAIGKDLAVVVDGLGLARLAIVAHSTAGHAAIGYAARCPDRVSRLVLVDAGAELKASGTGGGGGRSGEGGSPGDGAPGATSNGQDGSFAEIADYQRVLARFYPRAAPETLARLARQWLRERADGRFEPRLDPAFWRPRERATPASAEPRFDRKAWAEQGEAALWRDLAKVRCPTLVVRGADSPMLSRATVERMVGEVLVAGRSAEVPDSGHVPMIENPAALREVLLGFL